MTGSQSWDGPDESLGPTCRPGQSCLDTARELIQGQPLPPGSHSLPSCSQLLVPPAATRGTRCGLCSFSSRVDGGQHGSPSSFTQSLHPAGPPQDVAQFSTAPVRSGHPGPASSPLLTQGVSPCRAHRVNPPQGPQMALAVSHTAAQHCAVTLSLSSAKTLGFFVCLFCFVF